MGRTPKGSNQSQYGGTDYGNQSYRYFQTNEDGLLSLSQQTGYTEDDKYASMPNDSPTVGQRRSVPTSRTLEQEFQQSLSLSAEPGGSYSRSSGQMPASMNNFENSYAPSDTTCPECSEEFRKTTERDRHFLTVHANKGDRPYKCEVVGCQADASSWTNWEKFKKHKKDWHGPYPCPVPGCSRGLGNGFRSGEELNSHAFEIHGGINYTFSTPRQTTTTLDSTSSQPSMNDYVQTYQQNSYTQPNAYNQSSMYALSSPYEQQSTYVQPGTYTRSSTPPSARSRTIVGTSGDKEPFDSRYRIEPSKFFKPGTLFKLPWSEAAGSSNPNDTDVTDDEEETRHGDAVHHKFRRFIVMKSELGHSICLPVLTYGGQGTLKPGCVRKSHAIVYSSKSKPEYLDGERKLRIDPVEVTVGKRTKISKASRVNIAKIYTIEHNVKVLGIGKVSPKGLEILAKAYNHLHPPLPTKYTDEEGDTHRKVRESRGSLQSYTSMGPLAEPKSYPSTNAYTSNPQVPSLAYASSPSPSVNYAPEQTSSYSQAPFPASTTYSAEPDASYTFPASPSSYPSSYVPSRYQPSATYQMTSAQSSYPSSTPNFQDGPPFYSSAPPGWPPDVKTTSTPTYPGPQPSDPSYGR